jgi:hypothetical protein
MILFIGNQMNLTIGSKGRTDWLHRVPLSPVVNNSDGSE